MEFKQCFYRHSHYIISPFDYTLCRIHRVSFLCHTKLHNCNVTVRYKNSVQYLPPGGFFGIQCKIKFWPGSALEPAGGANDAPQTP